MRFKAKKANEMKLPELELSIVVISFNTLEMTKECLETVYNNQPTCSFEVILVDNNSEDGSVEMVKSSFPEVVLIENKHNAGFAAANNQGFEIAKGKNLLLLNSDTLILGDVLQKSVDFIEENTGVGAMGCRVLNTDRSTQLTCSMFPSNFNLLLMTLGLDRLPWPKFFGRFHMRSWSRDSERDVDAISGCYLLIRSKIVEEVGGLDESFFFFGEETEWCQRIRRAGWELKFAPVGEIVHHGSGSARKLNFQRDIMLTRATILLHRKVRSEFSAYLCFLVLFFFNASRAVLWSILSITGSSARSRAKHFIKVVAHYFSTWPKGMKT